MGSFDGSRGTSWLRGLQQRCEPLCVSTLNEEGVGIVPFRQQDAASSDTIAAKTMSQLLRGLLSALVVIHVEGEIDRAWPLRQLLELLRVKMRAQRAGGVVKTRLP